jgi:hypothetical protein
MPSLNATFSRRTFLGGVGASVATAVAHTAASALLPPAPLAVNALMRGADALAALEATLASPHLDLRAILMAPPRGSAGRASTGEEAQENLAPAVHRLLARSGSKALVFELRPNGLQPSFDREPGLPTLLLGSFSGYWIIAETTNRVDQYPTLTRLLHASPRVYVDDPLLATRIASAPALAALAPRTTAGLCSSVDPAVDFALSHLRSGAIGPVTQISTSLRGRDAANRLEARAVHQRLLAGSSPGSFPALRFKGVASVHPVITLRGTRGHLQIALYTARDRHVMLPVRLQHFTSVARGNAES